MLKRDPATPVHGVERHGGLDDEESRKVEEPAIDSYLQLSQPRRISENSTGVSSTALEQ